MCAAWDDDMTWSVRDERIDFDGTTDDYTDWSLTEGEPTGAGIGVQRDGADGASVASPSVNDRPVSLEEEGSAVLGGRPSRSAPSSSSDTELAALRGLRDALAETCRLAEALVRAIL